MRSFVFLRSQTLNLAFVSLGFYRTADPFERSQLHCTELTYGYCDFSAPVDSLTKWIQLGGGAKREKLSGSETPNCVHTCSLCVQLALIRNLHGMSPASVRPCSRNGRCSTSANPATLAATGQCPMSTTGPGPTPSSTARGRCPSLLEGSKIIRGGLVTTRLFNGASGNRTG